jgi:hypothetical protein
MTSRRILGTSGDQAMQQGAARQGLQRGMPSASRNRSISATQVSLRRRGQRYLQALRQLDASGATKAIDADELRKQIDDEFPMPADSLPQGIIATCYLGPPFQVHTLDAIGGIIEHFPPSRPLPAGMEQHRALAMSPHYLAIEVYSDRIVCVKTDGSCVDRSI